MGKPKNEDAKEFFNGYLSSDQAAKLAGVSQICIYMWAKKYGLGKKLGGRWVIYPDRFQRFLDGNVNNGYKKKRKEVK